MMEVAYGFGEFVPLLWSGLQFVCGLAVGGVIGGWIGYKWNLRENRVERKRAFEARLGKLALQVGSGPMGAVFDAHRAAAIVVDDALGELWPDIGRKARKRLEQLRAEFAGLGYGDLSPSNSGETEQEKQEQMYRGYRRMKRLVEAMLDVV